MHHIDFMGVKEYHHHLLGRKENFSLLFSLKATIKWTEEAL